MKTLPSSIQLAGLTVQVIIAPTLHKDTGFGGHSEYSSLRIVIAGDLPPQMQWHTFWHEVTHFILFLMGEDELCNNEKFVDMLAAFVHQVADKLE